MTEKNMAVSTRVKHLTRSRFAGWRRHDLRIGDQPAYVDGTRSDLNDVFGELPMPAVMNKRAAKLREQQETKRAAKSTNAIATCGIVTFGKGAQDIMHSLSREEQNAALLRVARAVSDRYNVKLHAVVVHRDETAIHAHYTMDSRNEEGKPLSKIMRGATLQDIAAEAIQVPGIVRGTPLETRRENGEPPHRLYNRSVQQLHNDLPREIEEKRTELTKLQDDISTIGNRLAKLHAKEELADKEQKRIETYSRRLAKKAKELAVESQALQRKEEHLDRIEDELEAALKVARSDDAGPGMSPS